MAKFSGKIGFAMSTEIEPGIWCETVIEKKYYGDVLRDYRSNSPDNKVVQDITISNQFSIVANSFAKENLGCMRYLEYLGTKWKIERADVQYPRLILTVGGVWNGPEQSSVSNNS